MTLVTDAEIREAIAARDVEIDPLEEQNLQPASYDLRLGERAIVTRSVELDTLRDRIAEDGLPEIDVSREGSISVPAGGFALLVTRERIKLSRSYAGHLGLRSAFARKGILLLSGLQVDPGFDGHPVLGLANLSPRSVYINYDEAIATLELHRLSRPAAEEYAGAYAGKQLRPTIPRVDADYLRTIETLSISDLTKALLQLSDNVSTLSTDVSQLSRNVERFSIPVILIVLGAVLLVLLERVL